MITQPEQWPDELDALIASPQHHKLLLENEFVRVLDTNIPPGEMTALHTHGLAAAHIVINGLTLRGMMRRAIFCWTQEVLAKSISPHTALWSEPIGPHALKNVGLNELHIISVEIKNKEAGKNRRLIN